MNITIDQAKFIQGLKLHSVTAFTNFLSTSLINNDTNTITINTFKITETKNINEINILPLKNLPKIILPVRNI
mgnify:CR=1 FL=1